MVASQVARLNQLIAVRKGVQAHAHSEITRLHHDVQKAALLAGISRTYRRINDADPDLPGEATRVQLTASKALLDARAALTRQWDVTAAVDWTNAVARADIIVGDGQILTAGVPAPHLLFLEKQLLAVRTFINKLPVLDPAERWEWSDDANAWAAGPATTTRTQKVPRNHEVAPATERHPAQVQVYQEDVIVGYWDTIKFSGALPAVRKAVLLDRVDVLAEAVKTAREQANMTEVTDPRPADSLFAWLMHP